MVGCLLIVAISPFATSVRSGHLLVDDEYYLGFLLRQGVAFNFYTGSFSASRLRAKFPEAHGKIHGIDSRSDAIIDYRAAIRLVEIPQNSTVVFLGYTEILVFLLLIRHIAKDFGIVLFATNNISRRRCREYATPMYCFFRLISKRLRRIVVHTQYEVRLISRIGVLERSQVFAKRHHLMTPNGTSRAIVRGRPIRIAYFGPPKFDKPIDPVVDLVRGENSRGLEFRLYGVSSAEFQAIYGSEPPANVKCVPGWVGAEEYAERVASADLIVLTHSLEFEGKLSGNLCDCFAFGVPYLARPMEPTVAYQAMYGEIGYLHDFSVPGWAENFMAELSQADLARRASRLSVAAKDFHDSCVQRDLREAFSA